MPSNHWVCEQALFWDSYQQRSHEREQRSCERVDTPSFALSRLRCSLSRLCCSCMRPQKRDWGLFQMNGSRKYPFFPSWKVIGNSKGGGEGGVGVFEAKLFKGKYEATWISREVGASSQRKTLPCPGGVWIFSGRAQCTTWCVRLYYVMNFSELMELWSSVVCCCP